MSAFVSEFLDSYVEYMMGVDGAYRNLLSSENEVAGLRDIFAAAELTGDTLKPLFDRDHFTSTILIKYRNAVTSKGKIRSNSTMKTYMQYLKNVGKFIISQELYAHVGVTSVEVHSFQVRLKTIIDNYHKCGELDKHVRTEDETDKINEHMTDENI